MKELNDKFHYAIWSIENEVMEKMANLLRRMSVCITTDGGHFEHLLWKKVFQN